MVAMSDFITNGELRIEAERLCDENERLKAENDRMHGVLQRLYGFAYDENPDGAELNFADELREFGIEVPR